MVTVTSVLTVQQLQQDLSKKNMFFSKDFIKPTKVIGQGKLLCKSAIFIYDQDTEGSVLMSKVSWGAGEEKQNTSYSKWIQIRTSGHLLFNVLI